MTTNIRLVSHNICGAKKGKDQALLQCISSDIYMLQETHLTDTFSKSFRNFNVYRNDHTSRSCGVMTLIRKKIISTQMHDYNTTTTGRFLHVKIRLALKTFHIINIYAHNNKTERHSFITSVFAKANELASAGSHVIIGGDFNTSFFKLNQICQQYDKLKVVSKLGCKITFQRGKARRELDYFVVNKGGFINNTRVLYTNISDHFPITANISIKHSTNVKAKRKTPAFNKQNYTIALEAEEQSLPWSNIKKRMVIKSYEKLPTPRNLDQLLQEIENEKVKALLDRNRPSKITTRRLNPRKKRTKIEGLVDTTNKIHNDVDNMLVVATDFFKKLYKSNTQSVETSPLYTSNSKYKISISEDEISAAITQLKANKAPGPDGITPDCVKQNASFFSKKFKLLFDSIINGTINDDELSNFVQARLVIMYKKKGDPTSMDNYRGLSILNVEYRIFTKIIEEKLRYLKTMLSNTRLNTFNHGRNLMENIVNLLSMIEKAKYCDDIKKLFILLCDIRKAFDTLSQSFMFQKLDCKFMNTNIYNMLSRIYHLSTCCLEINGYISEPLNINSGVKQGCSLSVLFFPIMINYLLVLIEAIEPFSAHAHADDTVAAVSNIRAFNKVRQTILSYSTQSNLWMSPAKSQLLSNPFLTSKTLFGIPIVKYTNYLGITLGYDGPYNNMNNTIDKLITRLENAAGLFYYFRNKIMVLNMYAIAMLQYKLQIVCPTQQQIAILKNICVWYLLYSKKEQKYDPSKRYHPFLSMDRFKNRRDNNGYALIDIEGSYRINCIKHYSRMLYKQYKNNSIFIRDIIHMHMVADRFVYPPMIKNQHGLYTCNPIIINFYEAMNKLKWRIEYRPLVGEQVWILKDDYKIDQIGEVVQVADDLSKIEFQHINITGKQICYGKCIDRLVVVNEQGKHVPFNQPSKFKWLATYNKSRIRIDDTICCDAFNKLRNVLSNHLEHFTFKLIHRALTLGYDTCHMCGATEHIRNHFYSCNMLQIKIDRFLRYKHTLLQAATTDQPTVSDVVVLQWAWRLYATDINDKCNALITSIKKQNRMCKIKNLPIIVYTLQNLNVVMCDPSTE